MGKAISGARHASYTRSHGPSGFTLKPKPQREAEPGRIVATLGAYSVECNGDIHTERCWLVRDRKRLNASSTDRGTALSLLANMHPNGRDGGGLLGRWNREMKREQRAEQAEHPARKWRSQAIEVETGPEDEATLEQRVREVRDEVEKITERQQGRWKEENNG
jgi:hypothetical protein